MQQSCIKQYGFMFCNPMDILDYTNFAWLAITILALLTLINRQA